MDNINYIYDVIFSLDHQKGTSSTQESNQATHPYKSNCSTSSLLTLEIRKQIESRLRIL